MVLYRSSVTAQDQMASASPEQAQEGMEMWMRWSEKAGSAVADMGSPLGGSRVVPAGADVQTGTPVAGFSVLEAGSLDDAVALLDGHPHLMAPGAAIEVLEYLEIPGM
jgi:hypothetical protein